MPRPPNYLDPRFLDIKPALENIAEANYASGFYQRLLDWINDFDNSLDAEHEAGARLASFGREVTFHIDDLGYSNPSLIVFYGTTPVGEPVELIQHVSQISVLLVRMPRRDPSRPKGKIGFDREPVDGNSAPLSDGDDSSG